MNFKLSLISTGLIAGSALAFWMTPAQASTFSFTASDAEAAGCQFSASCIVNSEFNLSVAQPSGSLMTIKHVPILDNFKGIGISEDGTTSIELNGGSEGEIDPDEVLAVDFQQAIIDYIDLGFLYPEGVFGDLVFETIEITSSAGETGTLQITGETTATWTLDGSVVNLSPSRDFSNPAGAGQGLYRLFNPFGTDKLTGFTATAIPISNSVFGFTPVGHPNSDFVLAGAGITTMMVPEPGTLGALIGTGALAALSLRRRRRNKT